MSDRYRRTRYDHVFRNALIYDGTGAPPFAGEVAVSRRPHRRRRRRRAPFPPGAGRTEHDLRGHALAPGFIDAHTHDDRIVLDAPDMLPKISQGVTTVVAGNCGISLAPVTFDGDPPAPMNLLGGKEAYRVPALRRLRQGGRRRRCRRSTSPRSSATRRFASRRCPDIKVGRQRGSGRRDARPCRRGDGVRRCRLLDRPLLPDQCAAQTSTRSRRSPTRFAEHGGVYATHMRDETDRVLDSIDEALATAGRAEIQLVISHHKCAHPRNWGRTRETLPEDRGGVAAPAGRGRLLPLHRRLDQPPHGPRHRPTTGS